MLDRIKDRLRKAEKKLDAISAAQSEQFAFTRLQALAFKAIRQLYPSYPLWRDFPYENELTRLAIDVINGGPGLREWVDNPAATPQDLEAMAFHDEAAWVAEVRGHLLY